MDTIKRINELDPRDLPLVERVFGLPLGGSKEGVLILRVPDPGMTSAPVNGDSDVPSWCNVLEGMSDQDLADFDAIVDSPVKLASPRD